MNRLDEKILREIFIYFDCLNELLRISMVCRQWRTIIMGKDFIEKRFIHRRQKYLINHWKFDKIPNFAFDSKKLINSNEYFQTGHLQQDICFLGSCLIFDAHSSITIPLNNYQSLFISEIKNTHSMFLRHLYLSHPIDLYKNVI
jgi:hypothetical protein